jgi:hypothetical protein
MTSQYETRFTSSYKEHALELERQQGEQRARMEYILPLVMLAIGFIFGAGWPALTALKADGPLALIITCRLFGTGAGHLWLGLFKLAGIFSLLLIAAALVAPLGCWGWIILIAIMAGMIAWQFELELVEGLAVAVVCWLVFVVMVITISLILS